MSQRVLLTGASGYLGSRVAHLLLTEGFEVDALLRPESNPSRLPTSSRRLRLHRHDGTAVFLSEVLEELKPELVVHIAGLVRGSDTIDQVDELVGANVLLGAQLLAAQVSGDHPRRFLHTGSFWEEVDQAGVPRPMNLYAATKLAFERILSYHADAHDFATLTLRLFHTYGPDDPRPKVFSHLARSVGAAAPVPFSPGDQLLDLVHVDDVARAYLLGVRRLLTTPPGHAAVCEIGSGAPVSLRELAERYARAQGVELSIAWGERPHRPREVMTRFADLTAARTLLGWEPEIDLDDGLRNL